MQSSNFLATTYNAQYQNNVLTDNASIDQWLVDAHLNWNVGSSPVFYERENQLYQAPNRQVLYRDDTGTPLGVVSNEFNAIQPREVMELYSDLSGLMDINLEAAGFTRDGKNIWALANTHENFRIMGQDDVRKYLFFHTANDGTAATSISLTSMRVVCNNMLNVVIKDAEDFTGRIRIPHRTQFDRNDIIMQLNGANDTWEEFGENANILAERRVTREEATKYFVNLYAKDSTVDLETLKPRVERIMNIYENGVGQDTRSAHGTAWGLVNAVTRLYDHETRAKNTVTRFHTANFGAGANMKQKAFNNALELVA